MGKSRDAFGQVLTGLRERLKRGDIRPGEALSISDLAQEFRTSTTPVREALATLAGEGLLAASRRVGFMRPMLEAHELADHYDLHQGLVEWSVRKPYSRRLIPVAALAPGALAFFAHVVSASGSAALMRAHGQVAQGLAPAFAVEAILFSNWEEELDELHRTYLAADTEPFLTQLRRFHARRRSVAGDLEAEVRRTAKYTPI